MGKRSGRLANPFLMRRLMAVQLAFWIALTPVANVTGWVKSPTFISELSLAAMVLAAGTLLYTSNVECQRAEEDVASEVVEKIVDETELDKNRPREHARRQG